MNEAAAARDGVVGLGAGTIVTENPNYGPTALMLVRGEEIDGPTLGHTQYSVAGGKEQREMFKFLECRSVFRVLRGYRLKSKYAPRAGLRYDGL